ncbi:sterol desaturase family protein [Mucilaginibacter sp. Bleaf8]|uniref:sterol desaturase family protein n=1 Tax=Mucilaginibacter sp. Bleaf8 TaxID=2834430 RepID=UPI001BCD9B50|nr:sterol desaturase family protein [Mucilaginibacter sp. Bleaf8]MBS7566897.1 sterol desaturase family protein [Mucilaginibacter sp. Bleaf8]
MRLFGVSAVRYFVIAGVPFILFYKLLSNWFSQSKIQNRNAGIKDFVREVLHSMQSTAVFAVIGYLVLFTPLQRYTQVYTDINAYPVWWIAVSLILSLIIHDTYFYWMHRLLHHKKLFRYTHLVHHQSTNPSPWTSYSFHILEACVEGGVLFVVAILMPLHPITIVLFTVVGFMINVYGHLGYEVAPQGFRHTVLFEVLNTSVHHNLHHSKFKGNYGLYFRVWDRLMGTEHPDYVKEYDRIQQKRFGKAVDEVIKAV